MMRTTNEQMVLTDERKLAVFRTVVDGLGLPFRRPVLLLPFLLTGLIGGVLFFVTLFGALLGGGLGALVNPSFLLGAGLLGLLGLLAIAVLLETGVEATSVLAARAELGRDTELGAAFGEAMRRLPAFFGAMLILGGAGWLSSFVFVPVGLSLPEELAAAAGIALLVLVVFVGIRLALVPAAIVVGVAGPIEAFRVSWQLTQGNLWRLCSVVLLTGLGTFVLIFFLMFVPIVGWFVAGWLAFAGMTAVLTLAYVRLGGRVAEAL
jgi:hypothetical protein